MDKIAIAICYEPTLYAKRYNEGRMFKFEMLVSDYFKNRKINVSHFDMMQYANALRTFVEIEMMGQKGKFLDFLSSDKVFDDFVWDYYYPYEHFTDKFCQGNQVILLSTLAEPRRLEQLISRTMPRLREYGFLAQAKTRLFKIYVGDCIRNVAHFKEYSYDLKILLNPTDYEEEWLKNYLYDAIDPYFQECIKFKTNKRSGVSYIQLKGE